MEESHQEIGLNDNFMDPMATALVKDLEQESGEPGDQPHDSCISRPVKAGSQHVKTQAPREEADPQQARMQNASPKSWISIKGATGTRFSMF